MEPDGNQLVESVRRGNQAAAVRLIDLFYERIYAFLRRLSGNDADAADLTQHTFKRAWQSLPSFAGRSSVGSWLHGIAYHIYVDWRRADRHTEPRSTEWWAACRADGASPAEVAIRNDLATALYAFVERLEPDLRDTVHLHYYQDLTLQETSDALGVATSTVKYRLRQALSELQKKLGSDDKPQRPSVAAPRNL
jgi:RNA polymerase sigma-70 factor (ECF subfamily)